MACDDVTLSFECPLNPPVYQLDLPMETSGNEGLVKCEYDHKECTSQTPLAQFNISLTELLRPESTTSVSMRLMLRLCQRSIALKQKACGHRPTWQHKLLYHPRHYLGASLPFYRKISLQFADSWCPIFPVLDKSGGGVSAMLILPFRIDAMRVTRSLFRSFLVENMGELGLVRALGTYYAEELGIRHVAEKSVTLRKARTAVDFYSDENRLSRSRSSKSVGRQTTEERAARNPRRFLYYENGQHFTSFFGLPTKGRRCRLIFRPHQNCNGAPNGDTSGAIDTKKNWFDQVVQAVDQKTVMGVSGRVKLGEQIPHQNLLLFFGGKDMVALDWLPTISRLFHTFATQVSMATPATESHVTYNFNTSVILFEFPGYGFSVGASTPAAFREHVKDIINRLLSSVNQCNIDVTVVGYSLGTGMAIETAEYIEQYSVTSSSSELNVRLTDLVLIATPTHMSECATQLITVPKLMEPIVGKIIDVFNRDDLAWNNYEGLERFIRLMTTTYSEERKFELTFVHGTADRLVRPALGRQLYDHTLNLIANSNCARKDQLLRAIKFEYVRAATHWSVLGDPTNLTRIYEQLYKAECVTK